MQKLIKMKFVYDETNFDIVEFYKKIKKQNDIGTIVNRINDILTYQNWCDKSLSVGTNYFQLYEQLKYYKLEELVDEVNHQTIFNSFKEVYEWFLDDENYLEYVTKLLNVFIGYDHYEEVTKYKEWMDRPKSDKRKRQKKKSEKPEEEIKVQKENEEELLTKKLSFLKSDLSEKIELANIDKQQCYSIIDEIFFIKNTLKNLNNGDEVIKYLKTLNKQDKVALYKHLYLHVNTEIVNIVRQDFKNHKKNIKNNNNSEFSESEILDIYVKDFGKKCIRCDETKFCHYYEKSK